MENLEFVQLTPNVAGLSESNLCQIFRQLVRAYSKELDEHRNRVTPPEFIEKWIDSMIRMQGESTRHLELCYADGACIGFLYGKIDQEGDSGFIKPGYGYVMEFYVKPAYRKNGYGTRMWKRLEALFLSHGAVRAYLTADPVTGRPFWEAMGFQNSGVQSPENHLDIYEKDLLPSGMQKGKYSAKPVCENGAPEVWRLYRENLDALHGSLEITQKDFADMLKASWEGTDERNFLIYQNGAPVGWMKVNGLDNEDIGWISMLVIAENYHQKGVGTFAVHFAEEYIRSAGKRKVGIHTTEDNIPARNLYAKCGYVVTEYGECTTGDGKSRMGYTFEKMME